MSDGDLNFNKILNVLRKINHDMPDLRFTEIIQNAADESKRKINANIFDMSSKRFLLSLEEYYLNHKKRRGL